MSDLFLQAPSLCQMLIADLNARGFDSVNSGGISGLSSKSAARADIP
jgi:hypothetical protein